MVKFAKLGHHFVFAPTLVIHSLKRSKAKNCKILLGMTADVLLVVRKFKYEQSFTRDELKRFVPLNRCLRL